MRNFVTLTDEQLSMVVGGNEILPEIVGTEALVTQATALVTLTLETGTDA